MFEAAVQENILVNEMLWQELPEEELEHGNDIKVLDDELDECIKETATKRKKFPRKICGHVAKTMKAEREKLKLQQAVTIPKRTLQLHLEQVTTETELMENASIVSQEMNDIMKCLPALMEKADRLSQSLTLLPAIKPSETHKAVFSSDTERCFKTNNEEEVLSVRKMDVTPTETGTTKTSESRNPKRKKWACNLIRKYPKRRLHLNH
uniref:Kinetochore-associated protein NSL1-like protein n=1 Tax=Callorhinchus milii TaxID=7868 RepID=A0A4W3J3P9_CALMI|eukprot:gi/632973554/ref/XP_007903210.1/ PREDICTED: kinetochore-associated protein NSL1 homolog [Callorhinchus milii]